MSGSRKLVAHRRHWKQWYILQRIERFERVISLLIVKIRLLILIVAVLCALPRPPCIHLPGSRLPSCVFCLLVYSISSWQYRHFQFQNQCKYPLWDRSLKLGRGYCSDPTKLYNPAQHACKIIHSSYRLIMFENSFFFLDAHRGSSRLSVYVTAALPEQT